MSWLQILEMIASSGSRLEILKALVEESHRRDRAGKAEQEYLAAALRTRRDLLLSTWMGAEGQDFQGPLGQLRAEWFHWRRLPPCSAGLEYRAAHSLNTSLARLGGTPEDSQMGQRARPWKEKRGL